MCCPKGKCGCQYFILLTLKKQFMDTGVLDFFNKKLILDCYFCLKSGPVFLFQIFIFLFKLSKHNIYLTVKFTNKINPGIYRGFCFALCGLMSSSVNTMSWSDSQGIYSTRPKLDGQFVQIKYHIFTLLTFKECIDCATPIR
jgi:hypothetical protein